MTNARDAKRFLKPLLMKHPEMVFTRIGIRPPEVASVFTTPVGTLHKSIEVENLLGRIYFRLHYKIAVLAKPPSHFCWHLCRTIGPPGGFETWETPPEGFGDLVARRIEAEILPIFHDVQTPMDVLERDNEREPGIFPSLCREPHGQLVVMAMMNQLDAAEQRWFGTLLPRFKRELRPASARDLEFEGIVLPLLRARDRAGLGRLFRSWEEAEVDRLQLRPWWRPTPYPVELAA
jgi:hypothetical protein